jgi:hypothetical protein
VRSRPRRTPAFAFDVGFLRLPLQAGNWTRRGSRGAKDRWDHFNRSVRLSSSTLPLDLEPLLDGGELAMVVARSLYRVDCSQSQSITTELNVAYPHTPKYLFHFLECRAQFELCHGAEKSVLVKGGAAS